MATAKWTTNTPQHFTKEERKMRRLFMTVTIALLIIPAIAFAQEGPAEELPAALNAKFSPLIEAPQAKPDEPKAVVLSTYHWAAIFNYQASTNEWWSGLVIRNKVNPNSMYVRLYDTTGSIAGEGTFSLSAFNEQRIGMLKDFIGMGNVPEQGSVYVYGTEEFATMMIVGNSSGGFGIIEQKPISY
jgi:hypothetical protein